MCAIAGMSAGSLIKTYDFFGTSAPSGITTQTSGVGSYTYDWSATQGLRTAGDAGTGFVYTVQTTDTWLGNFLVQASFQYASGDNCPDPSIAIWPASNGRTSPQWNWGTQASRISYQLNCTSSPVIYGTSVQTQGTAFSFGAVNTWYTLHFYHEPTLSRTRALFTTGQNDWTISGTQLGGSTLTNSNFYSAGTPLYIGLASDADGKTLGAGCNFSGMRISPLS